MLKNDIIPTIPSTSYQKKKEHLVPLVYTSL